MGAVLQTAGAAELVAELTCCACSSVCGLVTRDSATRAKFRYCSFLMLATVTCIILLIPGLRSKLDKIPNLCNKVVTSETCDKFVGFDAAYRILLSLTIFHFLLAVLTIRVTRINSFRAKFNNSLWLFKMGLIFGITIGSFYIPRKTGFFRIWMYISLTGGFMFVMFQIILIIDFGHSWSLSWAEKLETGYTKLWYFAMAVVTLLMFSLSLGALCVFYIFFTHPPNIMKCHANVFYITFIGIQCFLAIVVSITPSVQQELSGAGLLQSSVVVLYTMYLTWNTLSAEPDITCNPLGNVILEYDSLTGVSAESIFGCLLTLILLIFACTVRASTSHLGKYGLALAESEDFAMATYREDEAKANVEKQLESGEKEISLGEYVGYNYSFFHIIMSLASLHILMVLTNWHSPDEKSNMKKLIKNWASVWVQMASSFVCILVYIWFLVTPLVKRVWGPTFGVIMDEETNYTPYHGPKPPKKGISVSKINSERSKSRLEILKEREKFDKDHNKEFEPRPESRNTFEPFVMDQPLLKRRDSEESIISAVSAISNARNRKSRKKNKLITLEETEDNDKEIGVPSKVIIPPPSSNSLHKEQRTKKYMKRKKHDREVMYSSCESVASRVSNYVKRNVNKIKRSASFRKEENESEDYDKLPNDNKINLNQSMKLGNTAATLHHETEEKLHEDHVIGKHKHSRHEKHASKINKKINDGDIVFETKVTQQKQSRLQDNPVPPDTDVSLVPSVFCKKAQKPETAKEILKLQWKILRTQAKVVKIQERIIRLQAEAEMAGDMDVLPTVESNFVEKRLVRTKSHHGKEHG